jgi:predicted GIY-YIG superfamily endonuclease
MSEGTVYLIHFARPVGDLDNPRGQARHYLGWAQDVEARLDAHAAGNGARLMQVIVEAGIDWQLARTWPGSQEVERRLKRQHNAPRLCPLCNPEGWRRHGIDP